MREPLRALFVQDHLGQTTEMIHGVTRYFLTTLPAFDRAEVEPLLCVLTGRHPLGASLLEAKGIRPIFLARDKWDFRVVLDLIRLVRERDIDLVQVSGFKATMLGRIAAIATGRASVAHIHDAQPMPAWVRLIQYRLARHTDAMITVSEAMRRAAIDDYGMPPERTRVLLNGVQCGPFLCLPAGARHQVRAELGLADDQRVIGIVGRVEPGKGVRELLRAMPAVLARCPRAVALVVGEGPIREECLSLAKTLGIANAVRFAGHRNDIPEVLAAMDVLAAPSVAVQGLGYAVLEAMCAGLPVIATRCGGPSECIVEGESGLLVSIGDVPALAEALLAVLTDTKLREALGQGARQRSMAFSVENHVEALQTLYRDVMATRQTSQ